MAVPLQFPYRTHFLDKTVMAQNRMWLEMGIDKRPVGIDGGPGWT